MVQRSKFSQEEIAEKLDVDVRTLRRYQKGERGMPIDLYWRLILVCQYFRIIPLMTLGLRNYWHKRKKQKKKAGKLTNANKSDKH
jgi:transcriptional regulator with XRE-family HTH domain